MTCQMIGFPPISTIGFGRIELSSLIRVPCPPARMTAFTVSLYSGCSRGEPPAREPNRAGQPLDQGGSCPSAGADQTRMRIAAPVAVTLAMFALGVGTAALAGTSSDPSDPANLVTNWSIENSLVKVGKIGRVSVSSSQTWAQYGSYSAKVVTRGRSNSEGIWNGRYNVEPATTYTISVWVYTPQGGRLRFGRDEFSARRSGSTAEAPSCRWARARSGSWTTRSRPSPRRHP